MRQYHDERSSLSAGLLRLWILWLLRTSEFLWLLRTNDRQCQFRILWLRRTNEILWLLSTTNYRQFLDLSPIQSTSALPRRFLLRSARTGLALVWTPMGLGWSRLGLA